MRGAACSFDGQLVTGHIVNNIPAVTAERIVLVLEHSNIDGVYVVLSGPPLKALTPWEDIVFDPAAVASGWVHSTGGRLQTRMNRNRVEFIGHATNEAFSGGFTEIGALPPGFRDRPTNKQ